MHEWFQRRYQDCFDILSPGGWIICSLAVTASLVLLFWPIPKKEGLARMDGCGEIRIFFILIVPLVRPMIGAFLLITFLGAWNNFIHPQIILQTPEKFPLAVAIAQLKGLYSTDCGLLMAGTMVSIVPVMCLFLLLQKDFIAGLTSGAVQE